MMLKDLPYKSKLASAQQCGLKSREYFQRDSIILYLGASSGTTITYISDIYDKATIFAIDLAPFMLKEIVLDVLSNKLKNVIPILADANQPQTYINRVYPCVDLVYQDVAQKNQLEIFDKNVKMFLKKDGIGMLALKSRSINTSKNPALIFKEVEQHLNSKYKLLEKINISKYQKDHVFYVIKKE